MSVIIPTYNPARRASAAASDLRGFVRAGDPGLLVRASAALVRARRAWCMPQAPLAAAA